MNPISCVQLEALLSDYFDGALHPAEAAAMDEHLDTCQACGAMVEDMRLAVRYAREAGEVEVPPQLIARIIEQTTGTKPADMPEWRHKFIAWWDSILSPVIRPMLEPRDRKSVV